MTARPRLARIAARIRMPLTAVAVVALPVTLIVDPGPSWRLGILGLFVLAMALYARVGTPRSAPVDLRSPVSGRWVAMNSPTSKVPSHGIHAWGQTYAVDLVQVPEDGSRPGFGWWPVARRPEDFPAFGAPVQAPMSGRVVRSRDGLRDHWSRTSPPGIAYLILESLRELAGPPGVLGNHVVIEGDDEAYVLLAHLQRGSLRVSGGDRVERGEVIAGCGNSGNSTEPHVHLQVMDRAAVWIGAGRPFTFDGGEPPANGDVLEVAGADRAAT